MHEDSHSWQDLDLLTHKVTKCGRRQCLVVDDVVKGKLLRWLVLAALCTLDISLASRIVEVARSFVDKVGTAVEEDRHVESVL